MSTGSFGPMSPTVKNGERMFRPKASKALTNVGTLNNTATAAHIANTCGTLLFVNRQALDKEMKSFAMMCQSMIFQSPLRLLVLSMFCPLVFDAITTNALSNMTKGRMARWLPRNVVSIAGDFTSDSERLNNRRWQNERTLHCLSARRKRRTRQQPQRARMFGWLFKKARMPRAHAA